MHDRHEYSLEYITTYQGQTSCHHHVFMFTTLIRKKAAIYIFSLSVTGNVAAAEPGCEHVPGPHLHSGRVPPLPHAQVRESNILRHFHPPKTETYTKYISICIISQ